MAFVETTEGAAVPATAGESMQVSCAGATGNPAMSTVSVTGGSLTVDGSSVVRWC